MKTYRFADSKVYEPDSPESLELQRKFHEIYHDIADGTIFRAGRMAGYEGWTIGQCPWLEGSPRYDEWCRGWRNGYAS
jgi:hypothetical protein